MASKEEAYESLVYFIKRHGIDAVEENRLRRIINEICDQQTQSMQERVRELEKENEKLKKEIKNWVLYKQNIDEALNSGDGTYRP